MNRRFHPSSDAKEHFPDRPFSFSHDLAGESLLTVGALLQAAHELPPEMIEYVRSAPQSEFEGSRVTPPSRSEIIRSIDSSSSWMIFRNMEQLPRYDSLMTALLKDLADQAPWGPTEILNPMCFVFLSSPRVLTPFHIDPEHNFLFQVEGTKTVLLNDPVKSPILLESEISSFYADEVGYSLPCRREREQSLDPYHLSPSSGVYIPVTAPHSVRNGDDVSISFSLTFRSRASETRREKYLGSSR